MASTKYLSPGLSTRCVHAGTLPDACAGGVNSPLYTSTAYAYPGPANENIYQRYFNTPNQQAVADKLAALEGAEAGLVFSSGMAAISTLLLTFLQPGDHAVFMKGLYGGTHALIQDFLARQQVRISWADTPDAFARELKKNTKLLYIESPSNPLLRCVDIAAVARLARERGILSVIDNTFATPINQQPFKLGIDLCLHSATKYLNGHSDLNAGIVVASDKHIRRLRACATNLGGMLDAEVCARLERGLKTLAIRVERHNANALHLARHLASLPAVSRVYYPGLESSPDHAIASAQMAGFGGMLGVELAEAARVPQVLLRLRIAKPALSLGGVETLVCVPAHTSHCNLSPQQREQVGISDGLIRISVGIEDSDDLLEDFDQAIGS
ncbi:MAG: PLP-dependent aspartate aminotransferase family protein [Verrucomicrobiota bacterium JB024]|nr:PLP-dependent aspartate aminotransferase family protein [Verrucomicrobiota bacterium JB024]